MTPRSNKTSSCRAVVQLFANSSLAGKLALRGGTALHKLVIVPPFRYSEDVDLVQTEAAPIGAIIDDIREKLDPWLGRPKRDASEGNVSLTYRFDSEIPPVRSLRVKIEINTREHFAVQGLQRRQFSIRNPWFAGDCEIVTFSNDELMATKLRALYQRRKGRDLFDLWLCLDRKLIEPSAVVSCFLEYMKREGHSVSRAEFEQNLDKKQRDRAFLSDTGPLLRAGSDYDSTPAMATVREKLIALLPGEPWRSAEHDEKPRRRKHKSE